MAEMVPGWEADLLLERRIDLRAGHRNRFVDEGRRGWHRRVVQPSHADHWTGELVISAMVRAGRLAASMVVVVGLLGTCTPSTQDRSSSSPTPSADTNIFSGMGGWIAFGYGAFYGSRRKRKKQDVL